MNLILITVDCLRADHLSFMGYTRETSPFIDSLAKNGMTFTEAIVNGAGTFASFTALMSSTYPFMGNFERLNRRTIAEVLSERGYLTAGFNDNGFLSPYFGFDRGFNHFNCLSVQQKKGRLGKFKFFLDKARRVLGRYSMNGQTITKLVVDWLKENYKQDFFLWIHYMDVHGPHYAPKSYYTKINVKPPSPRELISLNKKLSRAEEFYKKGLISSQDVELLKATYDAEIRYVDDCIKILFNTLEKLGIKNKTAVIITGDHGEEFFEHGGYHSNLNLYDEMIRVPLIVYGPKIPKKQINRQVEQIDIAPTILGILGEEPDINFIGKDLTNNPGSKYVITEAAYYSGGVQLLLKNGTNRFAGVSFAYASDHYYIYYRDDESWVSTGAAWSLNTWYYVVIDVVNSTTYYFAVKTESETVVDGYVEEPTYENGLVILYCGSPSDAAGKAYYDYIVYPVIPDEEVKVGTYSITWNGTHLSYPGGVYAIACFAGQGILSASGGDWFANCINYTDTVAVSVSPNHFVLHPPGTANLTVHYSNGTEFSFTNVGDCYVVSDVMPLGVNVSSGSTFSIVEPLYAGEEIEIQYPVSPADVSVHLEDYGQGFEAVQFTTASGEVVWRKLLDINKNAIAKLDFGSSYSVTLLKEGEWRAVGLLTISDLNLYLNVLPTYPFYCLLTSSFPKLTFLPISSPPFLLSLDFFVAFIKLVSFPSRR